MAHLKDSIVIAAPVEKVHGFASDIKKWPVWYVGLGEAESVEGNNSPGTVIKQSYTFMGMHIPVTSTVVENSTDADGGRHWKVENEGSLAGWQTWDYLPKEGGTLVEVDMEYAVPGSVLGKVADRVFIEKSQERALRHTLENLKQLTEA
jgi:coenzyme Q-binding protein COQ10